jgi:hypothetical protein
VLLFLAGLVVGVVGQVLELEPGPMLLQIAVLEGAAAQLQLMPHFVVLAALLAVLLFGTLTIPQQLMLMR